MTTMEKIVEKLKTMPVDWGRTKTSACNNEVMVRKPFCFGA
jgi:hypothetical protein